MLINVNFKEFEQQYAAVEDIVKYIFDYVDHYYSEYLECKNSYYKSFYIFQGEVAIIYCDRYAFNDEFCFHISIDNIDNDTWKDAIDKWAKNEEELRKEK